MSSNTTSAPIRDVLIFDTTLRDGEQSAFCTMFVDEKIEIAKKLEAMRVDVIEAGFAISSLENFETMKEITKNVSRVRICGLARSRKEDIDRTYEALKDYDNRMIHLFFPTSKIHIDSKMKKSHGEIIDVAREMVAYARSLFPIVEFTAEDTVRTDMKFLKEVYSAVIEVGARVINVADTVGCAYPEGFGKLICETVEYVKGINPDVRVSVHCHNDLGLALANSLAAIENGAEQVECTVNGIGERAGNCAMEQIVINGEFSGRYRTNVNPEKIYEISEFVREATGVGNPLAPVVGRVVFAHKAGIHQHAVINNTKSYEILNARDYGRKSEIIIGPHSGCHGMIAKALELGFEINKEEAMGLIEEVSEMVRQKKQKRFSDEDVREMLMKYL
jgi:2-isopropylmalate synthase